MAVNLHPRFAAYFSMEIALEPGIPTYAGGLGILAGDTLRAAADMGLPLVGVTLLHRKGYFEQHLDANGNQTESASVWSPEAVLQLAAASRPALAGSSNSEGRSAVVGSPALAGVPTEARASVRIDSRTVQIRAWQYSIRGVGGHIIPVYLLDTALPENSAFDQTLTDQLYGGDEHYRLCQEIVLGIGGVEMLYALGYHHILTYHMNEGHSSLLTLAVCERHLEGRPFEQASPADVDFVRKKCVFTTHTPVPAGFDQFPAEMAERVLGEDRVRTVRAMNCLHGDVLNMTYLGLKASHYINGVAMQHGEVSRGMFPGYPIHAITNGIHAATWVSPPFQQLYDKHIPEWRRDNNYLRYAIGITLGEIQAAHEQAKRALLDAVKEKAGVALDPSVCTIGFARRAATYKRCDFLFSDLERLKWIARQVGPLQVIYGGKAHPQDEPAKDMIRRVFQLKAALKELVPVVYVENYEMRWAQLLTSGVDLWLNTPQRPYEASGTSGMKAALNGVPSFSVPDGWWIEGHVEGATGWDIGHEEVPDVPAEEIASLYDKLEQRILPMFYGRQRSYLEVMRHAIALNGSFFNTQRMMAQYVMNAYFAGRPGMSVHQVLEEARHAAGTNA